MERLKTQWPELYDRLFQLIYTNVMFGECEAERVDASVADFVELMLAIPGTEAPHVRLTPEDGYVCACWSESIPNDYLQMTFCGGNVCYERQYPGEYGEPGMWEEGGGDLAFAIVISKLYWGMVWEDNDV
jgi:hypothetical protein